MKVTFLPAGKQVDIEAGRTLISAIWEAGFSIDSPCGGNHTCGKCKVVVTKGNDFCFAKEEDAILTEEEKKQGVRLACFMKVTNELVVMIPSKKERTQRNICKAEKKTELGIALDIGTTTVEYQVFDQADGRFLLEHKFFNPQRTFGADVISRITYAEESAGNVEILRNVLIKELNDSLRDTLLKIGHNTDEIIKIVIVGNTTMCHIAAGKRVSGLAKAPFTLEYRGGTVISASKMGIFANEKAKVLILPSIAGHVGADTMGCILALGLNDKKGTCLMADVGTNGEIVLLKEGRLFACSTAAGPAFEGAGITYGMYAALGAITKVKMEQKTLRLQVFGRTKPVGICGSGIIDAIACLLGEEIIQHTGYLPDQYCIEDKKNTGYPLYHDQTHTVLITREDIRQIQLAKAAIHAGILTLLKCSDTKLSEIDRLYLAGSFGSSIDIKNAMTVGLFPKMPIDKVRSVGNAALKGAKMVLLEEESFADLKSIASEIEHVELAETEYFKKKFIECIDF